MRKQGTLHCLVPLSIAATVAALMPADAAARDTDRCFTSKYTRPFSDYRLNAHGRNRGSTCLYELREGLAALRLPAEGVDIDDVAAVDGFAEYSWGFIDTAGELAIPPRFENVTHFHGGLAGAYDGAQWGYIDRRGEWAIEPQFEDVRAFRDNGIAAAVRDGEWVLIDRSGAALNVELHDHVNQIRVGDGTPVRVEVEYGATYENANGETLAVPEGITLVEPFGSAGLFIARRDRRYGLIDRDLEWQIKPDYRDISAPSESGAAAVAAGGPEGDALIRQDGSAVGKDGAAVRRRGDFWRVTWPDGRNAVFDLQGERIAEFGGEADSRVRAMGSFLVDSGGDSTKVIGPAFDEPVVLDSGLTPKLVRSAGLLVVFDGETMAGVILGSGSYLTGEDSKDGRDWFGQIAYAERHGAWTWFRDRDKALIQIVDPHGLPLLDEATRKRLGNHHIEPLETAEGGAGDNPAAIALISESRYCHCGPGAGMLMSDGQLEFHEDWQKVESLDIRGPVRGRRFAFHTDEGVGILDGQGSVILAAGQEHIDDFHHGNALVYGDGVTRVVDRSGQLFDIPNGFGMSVVAPGIMRYRRSAAAEALFSLYDLTSQQPITKPRFQDVGDFHDGQATAVSPEGKTGVIDRAGEWVLAPAYAAVEPVNGQLWIVQRRRGSDPFEDIPRALVDADGETIVPYTEGLLSATVLDNRSVEVRAHGPAGVHKLLSPSGEVLFDGREATFTVMGDLLRLRRRPSIGYLGDDLEWAVALEPGTGSVFHADAQRALRSTGERAEILDAKGRVVATLPDGEWRWPTAASRIIGRVYEDGTTKTKYADPNGEITLSVDGKAGVFHGDTAMVSRTDGEDGFWVDASGERREIPGRYSDLGLPADNGLAYAASGGRYGFIDGDGRYVIPPVYDLVTDFQDGRAIATTERSAMMIDRQGRPIARVASECGVRVLYGPDNERVWPERLPQRCRH
ncbi:WG repeat-containing protein [Arhodomonas aquaeolei]|uniref:WG repeat-containing protein n=1 Tax=Arhodomonas aquaeolei TaxID=2369 RepID=UPI0021689B8D|nr:WG repeat-containing protein [Arhodomonas aquaeolei]MCS4503366.1 WG repeat-containing protein [Arhodomonas aquaeolei]